VAIRLAVRAYESDRPEFYQPLEPSQTFFVVPAASYERRRVQKDQRVASYDIGPRRRGSRSARSSRSTASCGSASNAPTPDRAQYRSGLPRGRDACVHTGITLRAVVDQLDNVNFPRSGYAAALNAISARTALGSDADFARADVSGNYVASFGEHT
jgi:NTE family protein